MRAGQRSELVQIQRPAEGQDEFGQPVAGWVTVTEAWASIVHRTGLEVIRADAPASLVQASIRIPAPAAAGVTNAMRVLCADGTAYNIKGVLPDRVKREFVDLVCETGANEG
ncbi:phage head closure protein [Cupriavidus campinensis]|jgi:SPP1 family predicted phage head-tail adaptor|uniref:Phage head closure protein n=1 Tax=Cupriavidus campinensis TaxID=151783 RepID=A0AAE9HW19_9BURK|nr:phage head closure protein [Cupriavidus campinensis]URF02973.1 phage head closure protein [Cupriavidus campinensis]URF05482.1 phage head closure protein [Cupriavidus campinensis]